MRFKDLLVVVDRFPATDNRIEVAAELARENDAHLAALFVLPIPEPRVEPPISLAEQMIEHCIREEQEHAHRVRKKFEAAVERCGIKGEWRTDGGLAAVEVAKHTRYVDVVLVGSRDPNARTPPMPPLLPEDVALSAGRPVLVVPPSTGPKIGKRIVVAWNASREATRAVNDALPLLLRAAVVTVVVINPSDDIVSVHGEDPGTDIAVHLARHGVTAEVKCARDHKTESATLLSIAAEAAADLIVMGAYGHTRTRELILGGMTRDLLRQTAMPVLMSH